MTTLGLLVYFALASGLGCWPKFSTTGAVPLIGLRLTVGFAALLLTGYLLVAVAGVGVAVSFWIIATLAIVGAVWRLIDVDGRIAWREIALHPASLLLVASIVAVLVNGGVDYLPVGHDEFSHWLANPLRLHTHGTWEAAYPSFHHAGYTPGWPILLSLSWQPWNSVDFGASAAAPVVYYIAVTALVFDVVVRIFTDKGNLLSGAAWLYGWVFVLLFLTVEALGPLWSRTLLIEPPQSYGYAALLLLLVAAEINPKQRRQFEGAAGFVLAASYVTKSAALLFLPVLALLCVVAVWRTDGSAGARLRVGAITSALLLGPVLLIAVSWSLISTAQGCMYRPLETLTPEALDVAASYDWSDLAMRFIGAIGEYTLAYKLPISLLAAAGIGAALLTGRYRVPLMLVTMGLLYFAALYWFHLTCFGDYYFRTLNSIPRFTRVVLWMTHAVGLVLLLDVFVVFLADRMGSRGLGALARQRPLIVTAFLLCAVLGGWQAIELRAGVFGVTTRLDLNIDSRIAEVRRAATTLNTMAGDRLPKQPRLLLLAQGTDNAILAYAGFYAKGRQRGDVKKHYQTINEFSWSPTPINVWQTTADTDHVREVLTRADVIWPVVVDPWLLNIVGGVVRDLACISDIDNKFLVRKAGTDGGDRFVCFDKPSPVE